MPVFYSNKETKGSRKQSESVSRIYIRKILRKMLLLLSTLLEWNVCFDPLKKEDLSLINNKSIRDFYAFLLFFFNKKNLK